MKEKFKLYQGYLIIAILSLICIFFLPMLGSEIGLAFAFPTTAAGWLIWGSSKAAVILINLLLFDQFVRQAKINVRDNPKFIEAQTIFNKLQSPEEEYLPTPREYLSKLYRTKGATSFATSLLSVIAFSNAILTFNFVTMLTYLFTIVTGIIFGWITMVSVEDYWTDTYYKLAQKKERKQKEEEEILEQQQKQKNQEIISEENINVNNSQIWQDSSQS